MNTPAALASQEAQPPPAATAGPAPQAESAAAAKAQADAKTKPYEEALPEVPRRREPRRHLGGRAASPAVRGVRPRRPHLRVHRRGDRLQDGRSAIRPARARVHEALSVSFSLTATFGAFLTFMLIILYPKFTNYLMSVFSPRFCPTSCSSSSRPSFSTPTTTAGEIPSPGASRPRARPQPVGTASCSSPIRGSRS